MSHFWHRRLPDVLVRSLLYDELQMNSLFAPSGHSYVADTLLFAFSVALLTLPLAALIAVSLLREPLKQRFGRRELAPEPLLLRRSKR
jgi:membrane-associated phospholipid phosphatase